MIFIENNIALIWLIQTSPLHWSLIWCRISRSSYFYQIFRGFNIRIILWYFVTKSVRQKSRSTQIFYFLSGCLFGDLRNFPLAWTLNFIFKGLIRGYCCIIEYKNIGLISFSHVPSWIPSFSQTSFGTCLTEGDAISPPPRKKFQERKVLDH